MTPGLSCARAAGVAIPPQEIVEERPESNLAAFRFLQPHNSLRTQAEVPRNSNSNQPNRLQRGALAGSV